MKRLIIFTITVLLVHICNAQSSHPHTWDNVFDLGVKGVDFSTTLKYDTKDQSYSNFPSNGIAYKLTTIQPTLLEINTCGSRLNTVIVTLYNSSGGIIEKNSYNENGCISVGQGYININYPLPAGVYYIVCESVNNNSRGEITTFIKSTVVSSGGGGDGNTMATAFNIGSKPSNFIYIDTKNTNNFTNENKYSSGNDVYYKFTIDAPMDITVSHCGSSILNTYITLRGGDIWLENDDSWDTGACSNPQQAFMRVYSLPPGTYYIISEGRTENGNITTRIEGIVSGSEKKGETMASAIDVGIKSSQFTFRDTQDLYYYRQDYDQCEPEEEDALDADIYYKFTITKPMDITISNQEIGDYSFIHLFDSTGKCIAHHCAFFKAEDFSTVTMKDLPAGTYYVVTQGYWSSNVVSTIIEGKTDYYTPDPSTDRNYILTVTPTKATSNVSGLHPSEKLQSIRYHDGLGRPVETVQVRAGKDGADLVSYQEYDEFGRESNVWLPIVASSNDGAFVPFSEFTDKATNTYTGDSKPYSKPVYEASPLNRILKQYGPGQDWHKDYGAESKAVRTQYETNIEGNNILNCIIYTVEGTSIDPTLSKGDSYPTGELYVTEVKDEDENVSYEFKDKLGKVILKRQINDGINHDTYFVYDDFGNLCFVLPPRVENEGISQAKLDELAFLYKYDNRNRCIAKKLPGCDWIYYIYDKADRLIFTQDGEQHKKGEWLFSISDIIGRPVIIGISKDTFDIKGKVVKGEYTANGPYHGYEIKIDNLISTFSDSTRILTVNYYDNYDFMQQSGYTWHVYTEREGYGKWNWSDTETYKAKGLVTGTITYLEGVDNGVPYLRTANYYDNRKRLIQTKSNNHLRGMNSEYFDYNYRGQVTKRWLVQDVPNKERLNEYYTYTYDHAGRLSEVKHKLNDQSDIIIAKNEYDDIGRLKTNKKGENENLKSAYTYNLRSWTKSISGPLFSQNIYYNEDLEGRNDKSYNGNISAIDWDRAENTGNRSYTFSYDQLSRLESASYKGLGKEEYSTSYNYDKHGNMLSLARKGKRSGSADDYGLVDQLAFTYVGNQLKTVTDAIDIDDVLITESADFKGYATGDVHYAFNKNGAMEQDLNKGITGIRYNSLNLPQVMVINSSKAKAKNYYTYLASGVKLRVEQRYDPSMYQTPVMNTTPGNDGLSDSKITDYVGNKIYENGELKKILIEGGYYDVMEGKYFFFIQDHLGNNRVVADITGNIVQRNDYYPFGMEFADNTGNDQPYKYNNKELDKMHGLNLYDYSARYYDGTIPTFTTIDPLAEKSFSESPYIYVSNNPLLYIDPDGREKLNGMGYIGKSRVDNRIHQDNGMIHIYAHGNTDYFNFKIIDSNKKELETEVRTGNDLKALLTRYSAIWNNKIPEEEITIVLHCCNTGNFPEKGASLVEILSFDMPEIVFVAPTDYIWVDNEEEDIYNKPRTHMGEWVYYKNGAIVGRKPGKPDQNPDFSPYTRPSGTKGNTKEEQNAQFNKGKKEREDEEYKKDNNDDEKKNWGPIRWFFFTCLGF